MLSVVLTGTETEVIGKALADRMLAHGSPPVRLLRTRNRLDLYG